MDLPSKLEGAGCLTRWPCHLCTLSVVQISVHNSAQEGGSVAVGRSDTTCVRGYRYFAHEHNPLILTLPDYRKKNVWHSSWARMTLWTLVWCSMYEQKCVRLYLFCPRHQWLTLDRPVQWNMNKTNPWSASDIMFFWLFYASRCLLSSSSTVSFSVCLLCSQTQPAYWSSRPPTSHGASMAPSMFLLSHRI